MTPPIVDSHIHFWDPDHLPYDWLANVPAINRAHLPGDLDTQAQGIDLAGIVFVQAGCAAEQSWQEAQWVSSLAEEEPRIQAIVAHAALEQGIGVRPELEALTSLPLVKGVRRIVQSEANGYSVQPTFVRGVQLLAEYGFSFDICVVHHQLDDTVALVQQCPEVAFVLDHIGKPAIAGRVMDPWRAQISTLAAFPNVQCKLSGMVTEADLKNWTPTDLRPYIDHVVDAFGVDRVMYGGDWPVSLLATTYVRWIEVLDQATAHLGDEAQQKLFAENVRRFYRLPRSTGVTTRWNKVRFPISRVRKIARDT